MSKTVTLMLTREQADKLAKHICDDILQDDWQELDEVDFMFWTRCLHTLGYDVTQWRAQRAEARR